MVAEEVVHFSLLAHSNPRDVLLIGGGASGDLREINKHPIDQVTYVEVDPKLIQAAKIHLPTQDASIFDSSRVHLAFSDGRFFVKQELKHISQNTNQATSEKWMQRQYDVIILDLPEPATGSLNRFYTREFFEEVRLLLKPEGILSLGLPSAENYWSKELARRNASIYHTLKSVFPWVVVLPGDKNYFLASPCQLPTDAQVLTKRLWEREIKTQWVTQSYIEYIFATDRFEQVRQELEQTSDVRLNHDLKPICYYYDMVLWLSLFYPKLRPIFEGAGLFNFGWAIFLFFPLVILGNWRRHWAVPIALGITGMVGMCLELVLLFAFQALHGYVYAQVSLIITAFIAGLAIGSWMSDKWLMTTNLSTMFVRRLLLGILLFMVVYSGLLPWIIKVHLPYPNLYFACLTIIAGILDGMAFPLALRLVKGNTGRMVGLMYGIDLVGGCLGAFFCAILFIPLLGVVQTCHLVALASLCGAWFVFR